METLANNNTKPENGRDQTKRDTWSNIVGGEILLSWQAKQYVHYDRSPIWYLSISIISLILIVGTLIMQEWIMAVTVALLFGVIYLYSHEKPQTYSILIAKMGIQINDRAIPYNNINSFWIIYSPQVQTLNLKMAGELGGELIVQLGEQDPTIVREVLVNYLPEAQNKTESFIDKIARILKI